MSKGLLFFLCACAITILTAINLSIGPIINKKVGLNGTFGNWGTANCAYYSDKYEDAKKGLGTTGTGATPGSTSFNSGKHVKFKEEWEKDECRRKKAMYNLEYTSFIFDIVIGFVCGLLGILQLLATKKEFIPKTGLIGLGCGIVGFVLTLFYVIYNGIVYTTYYDDDQILKRDSYGIFAQRNGDKFICFYHDEPANVHSIIAKYSDLRKKQYNYDRGLEASYHSDEVQDCIPTNDHICLSGKEIPVSTLGSMVNCDYLYAPNSQPGGDLTNKDLSDRFLTALILSLFVCLANIGLAILGFLLFKTPDDGFIIKFETVQSKM